MNSYKLLLWAILTLVLPYLLGMIQIVIISILKDILRDWQILLHFVPFSVGVIYLIGLWFYLKKIFNMESAFLSGLCVISALIGVGFFAGDLYRF